MTPEELASLNDLPPPPHPSLRAVTGAEAERFAVILARAFEATVACNPHRACFTTIRKHLIDHREDPEDEATVAACEASGALWECLWWSSSCGHFDFIAPTWPALVRKVIAADADLVAVAP